MLPDVWQEGYGPQLLKAVLYEVRENLPCPSTHR